MKNELRDLFAVNKNGVESASVLLSGRIMEAIIFEAISKFGSAPDRGKSMYGHIQMLEWHNLIHPAIGTLMHTLRRLSNDARHWNRPITKVDGPLSIAFLEKIFNWFFCDYALGNQLPAVCKNESGWCFSEDSKINDILDKLLKISIDANAIPKPNVFISLDDFWASPAFPTISLEFYVNTGRYRDAQVILDAILKQRHLSHDKRIVQLEALYHSRSENTDKAEKLLLDLMDRIQLHQIRRADSLYEETIGILAGVYKRKWLNNNQVRDTKYLEKASECYIEGWKRSGKTNLYLGINAATAHFILNSGSNQVTASIAEDIKEIIKEKITWFKSCESTKPLSLNYWDTVTWAEATVLLGNLSVARKLYSIAFQHPPGFSEQVRVTRSQLEILLPLIGMPPDVDQFLKAG